MYPAAARPFGAYPAYYVYPRNVRSRYRACIASTSTTCGAANAPAPFPYTPRTKPLPRAPRYPPTLIVPASQHFIVCPKFSIGVLPHPQPPIPALCHNETLSDVALIGKGHENYFDVIHAPSATSDKVALWQLSTFLFLDSYFYLRTARGWVVGGGACLRKHLKRFACPCYSAGLAPSFIHERVLSCVCFFPVSAYLHRPAPRGR